MLFDRSVSEADDENELEELETLTSELEDVFDVSLDEVRGLIGGQQDYLLEQMTEPPDDEWEDFQRRETPDADDREILAMFESMFD